MLGVVLGRLDGLREGGFVLRGADLFFIFIFRNVGFVWGWL